MTELVLISGSLRKGSLNSAAIRVAHRTLPPDAASNTLVISNLADVPLFDEDIETVRRPCAVEVTDRVVRRASGMLISTPDYNGAPPAALKNLLDWLSRPYGWGALIGIPVALMSASSGASGGAGALAGLRHVLIETGASPIEHEPVVLRRAGALLGASGEMSDAATTERIRTLVSVLAGVGRTVFPPPDGPIRPDRLEGGEAHVQQACSSFRDGPQGRGVLIDLR